jgi:hypothetical protein
MPKASTLLFLFLGIPGALCAQTQHGSWSSLNNLKAGQGIEVIETSMRQHAGRFVAVTDELLTLKEKGSDVSLKREDVARVSTSSGAKRGEHALIGLVVGGAIGAGIGAAAGGPSSGFLGGSSRGIGALVGVVIGAPSGAVVGAVVPAHTTIYRAAPVAASLKTTSSSGPLPTDDCNNTTAVCRKDGSEVLLSQPAAGLKQADSGPAPLPSN